MSKIEFLSSLQGDLQPLSYDVTTTIFRALHLSTEEKKKILPLQERPGGISIAEMRKYTADRFKTYEMMAWTIKKHWQPKNNIYGGAGLMDLDPP